MSPASGDKTTTDCSGHRDHRPHTTVEYAALVGPGLDDEGTLALQRLGLGFSQATSRGEYSADPAVTLGGAALKAVKDTLIGSATCAAGALVGGRLSDVFKRNFWGNYLSGTVAKDLVPELVEEIGEKAAQEAFLTTGQKAIASFFGSYGWAPLEVAVKAAVSRLDSNKPFPSPDEFASQVVGELEKSGVKDAFSECIKATLSQMRVRSCSLMKNRAHYSLCRYAA